MRILVATIDYPPIEGGISTVSRCVARELANLGHEVTVVAPFFPGIEDFDQNEPVTVVRFRGYRLGWFRFAPFLRACWPHLRRADAVFAMNVAYGGVLGLLARRLRPRPYVAFAYGYEFLKFQGWPLVARLLRRVYRRAAAVIAISRFTRGRLLEFGVPPSAVSVVLPGAPGPPTVSENDLEEVRHRFVLDGRNGGTPPRVILAVGRFVRRKGHLTLVRALPQILERHPESILVLVGRGPEMSVVAKTAWKLGVRDHVLLPGSVSDGDVQALYRICDVFALPTGNAAKGHVEGFGLVFAEAAAHGKPVVAGRSGGVEDAVLDEETGLLVEPDDPEALADAILRLLDDPGLACRVGENARRRVERELNWATFTRRVLEELGSGS